MSQSGIQLIKNYFGTPERPVTMDELKGLTKEDRTELADAVAKQLNLVKEQGSDGVPRYA